MGTATKRKDRDDINFLQATWDMLADISNDGGLAIDLRLVPTERRGVFLIRLKAYQKGTDGTWAVLESYTCEYPSPTVQELTAAIFRAANKLDAQIADRVLATLDYKGGQP